MTLDDPEVADEVRRAVEAYETALMTNAVEALDAFFWDSPLTVRYGVAESLHGFAEIAAFRRERGGGSPPRARERTQIITLSHDAAVAHVEFTRLDTGRRGRQSQVWIRTPEGWKVISAHVSLLQDGADQRSPDAAPKS
jgi:hypothetical protein